MKILALLILAFSLSIQAQAENDSLFMAGGPDDQSNQGAYDLLSLDPCNYLRSMMRMRDLLQGRTYYKKLYRPNGEILREMERRRFPRQGGAYLEHQHIDRSGLYNPDLPTADQLLQWMRRLPGGETFLGQIGYNVSNRSGEARIIQVGGPQEDSDEPGIDWDDIERRYNENNCSDSEPDEAGDREDEFLGVSLDPLEQNPSCANAMSTYCSRSENTVQRQTCAIRHQSLLGESCQVALGVRTNSDLNTTRMAEAQGAGAGAAGTSSVQEL